MFLLFLLILIPVIEYYAFAETARMIGGWPTAWLCIVTAAIGITVVKMQGVEVLSSVRDNMQSNKFPAKEIFAGICLAVAGFFLLLPGFFTDFVGFLLCVPPIRNGLFHVIAEYQKAKLGPAFEYSETVHEWQKTREGTNKQNPPTIEAEYTVIDENDKNKDRS